MNPMDESVRFRAMRWWDIPAVHAIEITVFPVDPWSVEQFWSELAQPTRNYLVAEVDGQIAGYAGSFVLSPQADVQTIAVSPAHQGRGLGAALLTQLIEDAHRSGASEMLLEVRSDNGSAMAMYEKFGFERISRRPNYYAASVDAHVMRLRPLPVEASHVK